MLFSAGVAVGLFVFGTAEPLYHYDYWLKQRFNGGNENQNDKANFAILTTIYHWGFHGWCVYTLVGLMMGVMAYRKRLPMTMRSCFYPLLGKHTWGWIGHIIDGFTIVTIVAGVCTSLGLGAIQIRRGLEGMGSIDTAACTGTCPDDILLGIIWGITAVATISVVSGLHVGIKTLSQLAFGLGLFILVVVFFVGSTEFYMNNMTQAVGYYLQYFMTQLGWHTDAFAQLGFGEGASPDGRGAYKAGEAYGGAPSFMDGWTIFYWGWWIAWSPFVGQFVARISRGRSVREVINYSLTGPLLFAIIWFAVFGGAAIQMENSAQSLWKAGVDLYNDPTYFQAGQGSNTAHNFAGAYLNGPVGAADKGFGSQECGGAYDINETVAMPDYCHPAGSGLMNRAGCTPLGAKPAAEDKYGHIAAKAGGGCGACFVVPAAFGNATYKTEDVVDKETGIAVPTTTQTGGMTGCEIFAANPNNAGRSCPFYIKSWKANPSHSPQCLFTDWDQEASWYNVVGQFYTIGPFLQAISIITLVLYFITSSDSGSLVVDTIAANGRDEQNPIQRVIWALIEGLVATGLVLGGRNAGTLSNSKNVLKALQAASICCGLPFTFMLCFMMPALWKVLKSEENPKAAARFGKFATPIFGGVFDVFESIFSLGAAPFPAGKVFVDWLVAAVVPWYSMNNLLNLCNEKGKPITVFGSKMIGNFFFSFAVAFCWFTWIVTVAMNGTTGLWSIGWAMWIFHAGLLTVVRMHTRNMLAIGGNPVEDFWACTVMYPTVYNQCMEALSSDDAKSE